MIENQPAPRPVRETGIATPKQRARRKSVFSIVAIVILSILAMGCVVAWIINSGPLAAVYFLGCIVAFGAIGIIVAIENSTLAD